MATNTVTKPEYVKADRSYMTLMHRPSCSKAPKDGRPITDDEKRHGRWHDWCLLCCPREAQGLHRDPNTRG